MVRTKLIKFRGNRSQAVMAGIYGVTQQVWSKWETGKSTPSAIMMKKIEMDSGVPMEKIFFDIFNSKELLKRNKATA